MKLYRYNKIIQLVFIVLTVLLLLGSLVEKTMLGMILFLQFFLGAAQYVTAWIIRYKFPENKLNKIYLTGATIYLIAIAVITSFAGGYDMRSTLAIILLFVVPWILAVLYWVMSFKEMPDKDS